jgi:hypothetical protein
MSFLIPHEKQSEVVQSRARFKVIRAGRRSGKTAIEIELMVFKAVSGKERNVFFLCPTQKQARSVVWEDLKRRLGKVGEANESRLEMKIPTIDGGHSTIFIAGWENRENFRGMKAYHITFDETDTCKEFFVGWQEIFRPALIDTGGTADFIGTPKKENPNLRRLEKEGDSEWASFQFTTADNPHIPREEIEAAKKDMDATTYRQEILAEYVENEGALFKYTSLLDMFTNTVDMTGDYLIVDIADDGSDKTIFTRFKGLAAVSIDMYSQMQTDGIINQIREDAAAHRIPYSQIAVDAIGVGAGVASSPLLTGVVGFKSSYGAMRTDIDPVRLPNVHYTNNAPLTTEYKNLRSQCVFILASLVNDHKFALKVEDQRIKSQIIEELSTYQDASQGDGKRMATQKEDVKTIIGRSPDLSDTLIMRMYFVLRAKLSPHQGEDAARIHDKILAQFSRNERGHAQSSTK